MPRRMFECNCERMENPPCEYCEEGLEQTVDNISMNNLVCQNQIMRTALMQISSEPKGAYSRDRVRYFQNVIEWCQDTARVALKEAQEIISS